jgi:uncharacterized protein with FMN-binding domain
MKMTTRNSVSFRGCFLAAGAVLLAVLCGCTGMPTGEYTAGAAVSGVYEGEGTGFRGKVRVSVHIENGGIAEIIILDHGDDEETGAAAMEELLDLALLYNTADLDAVSGATESSRGFLAAVEDALSKAGAE